MLSDLLYRKIQAEYLKLLDHQDFEFYESPRRREGFKRGVTACASKLASFFGQGGRDISLLIMDTKTLKSPEKLKLKDISGNIKDGYVIAVDQCIKVIDQQKRLHRQ